MLVGTGLVYAHWPSAAAVDGRVGTGQVDTFWIEWSCGDTAGRADLTATPVASATPSNWSYLGTGYAPPGLAHPFEIWQTDLDVAETIVAGPPGLGVNHVSFQIDNAYPSHYEDCEWGIGNTGTIPLAAPYAVIRALNPQTTFASTIFADDGALWIDFRDLFPVDQINPLQAEHGSFRIHVEQAAAQSANYAFEVSVCLHNWNEASGAVDDVCGLYQPHEIADGSVIVVPEI